MEVKAILYVVSYCIHIIFVVRQYFVVHNPSLFLKLVSKYYKQALQAALLKIC